MDESTRGLSGGRSLNEIPMVVSTEVLVVCLWLLMLALELPVDTDDGAVNAEDATDTEGEANRDEAELGGSS